MNLVVVSFAHEFASLLLQARSLARTNAFDFFDRYIIVWNDEHPSEYFKVKYLKRLMAALEEHANKLEIVPRSDLVSRELIAQSKGSRIQQALKLAVCRRINSDQYMVLDTKNHLIRPISDVDFYIRGAIRSHIQSYSQGSMFHDALVAALAFMRVDSVFGPGKGLPTTTPYIMRTKDCISLMREVESRLETDFMTAFLLDRALEDTTEFILYYAHLCSLYGTDLLNIYGVLPKNYVTFFNTSPSTEREIKSELDRIGDHEVKFLGLHRGRKINMPNAEKVAFINAWLDAGLFSDEADANAFLTLGEFR